MSYIKEVTVKKNIYLNLISGHPWIFSGAVESEPKDMENGGLCRIICGGKFIGIGYYNKNSDIRIRILSRKEVTVDADFFYERLNNLYKEKLKYLSATNAFRLCFGESDNLPGLVVDIYDDVAVIQAHTMGIDNVKKLIVDALAKIKPFTMIYEKCDISARTREGLPKKANEILYGTDKRYVNISENGFNFKVDIFEGQKTGFFLDQRENRRTITEYCSGKNVLNCFCYTGGFSVYAAKTAKSVTSVDISKQAIEMCKTNFAENNFPLENHNFVVSDVFDYLVNLENYKFDFIILDPPSFAKNKNQLTNAIKAYTTINSKALEKLPDYGILVSASCTTHVDDMTFIKILHQSAVNAKCQIKIVRSNIQPIDHPYNLMFPEGRYLKFYIVEKFPVL